MKPDERIANILYNEGLVSEKTDWGLLMSGVCSHLLDMMSDDCAVMYTWKLPDVIDNVMTEGPNLYAKRKRYAAKKPDRLYILIATLLHHHVTFSSKDEVMAFMKGAIDILRKKLGAALREKYPSKKEYHLDTDEPVMLDGVELEPRDITIKGNNIAVTGASAHFSRNEFFKKIEEAGGIVNKDVTFSTDYLVVCEIASMGYKYGSFGKKLEKAANKGVVIVAECDFIRAWEKACK